MKSIDVLADGLFDYAGMFPPAALDFEAMLAEAARFPDELKRPDLVGNDLVLTPDQLDRLDQSVLDAAGFEHDRLCRICVVGVDAAEAPQMARRILRFNRDRHGEPTPQHITSLEIHATGDPRDAVADIHAAAGLLGHTLSIYLEPKWTDGQWRRDLPFALEALDQLNDPDATVGLKVRCAGPNEVRPRTLARIMHAVAARGLPMKLTQGLHHALPAPGPGGYDHGFINTAVAFRLAHTGIGEEDLASLLAETDPAAFDFSYGVRWGRWHLPLKHLLDARKIVSFAIGSCSLGEPDEELARLTTPPAD